MASCKKIIIDLPNRLVFLYGVRILSRIFNYETKNTLGCTHIGVVNPKELKRA